MSSFATALSGLEANTTALNVVGDNLANMNTQGFKSDNVLFEDAMQAANASLQIGAGVGSTTTSRSFSQGSITTSSNPTSAAIQGSGFFVVQDPSSGATQYTRDGSFNLNASGQLVTSTGDLVQGWMATNGVVNASGATSAITVPLLTAQPPTATTTMSLDANLNANAAVGDTFSTPVQVIDSLGNTQTVTVTFTNTAAGAWSYKATLPGQNVTGGTAGTPSTIGSGTLTFDANGNLKTPASPGTVNLTNTAALVDGAANLNINWNLYDSSNKPTVTGYAQASASSGTSQNGTQTGTVTGVTLENGGDLVATYSNGNQTTLAQIAVASISNPDTLIATSNNNYTAGASTQTPSVGASGTSGRGTVAGGSLEASNVDMATEFTNLIVFQQGYEANSKVITTIDQMDQMLLQIQP
jgi:flagellar hook protein FlgE